MSDSKPAKKSAAKRTVKLDPAKLEEAEHSADKAKQVMETGELTSPNEPPHGEVMVRQSPDQSAVAPVNNDSREAVLSIVGGVTTEQLKAALTVQTEQRKLIKEFIQENLEDGVDYGKIHVVKNCPIEQRQAGSCDRDYHYSKSILMKPGQEKIFSLFSITDEITKDLEAYEMLGEVPGLVAYKCIMYRGDKRIGEGRGAAQLGSERSDPNSTIKKAEKRARMDACLSLGFSAYFTQDLDDPDYKSQREMMNSKAAAEAERRDKDDLGLWRREITDPIDDQERQKLFEMIKAVGYEQRDSIVDLLKANGIQDPKAMTSGQARGFMRKLRDGQYTPVAIRAAAPPDTIADVPDGPIDMGDIEELPPEEPAPTVIEEPQLVVDDDFKAHVIEQFNTLSLNARGEMWFKKRVLGKPFGKWEAFSDREWRLAYDALQDILDMRLPVPDEYISGYVSPPPVDPNEVVHQVFPGAETIDNKSAAAGE